MLLFNFQTTNFYAINYPIGLIFGILIPRTTNGAGVVIFRGGSVEPEPQQNQTLRIPDLGLMEIWTDGQIELYIRCPLVS